MRGIRVLRPIITLIFLSFSPLSLIAAEPPPQADPASHANEGWVDGAWTVIIDQGLQQQRVENAPGAPVPLTLEIERHAGAWRGVWGKAEHFNQGDHHGRVLDASLRDGVLRFHISLAVAGDPWVPGGRGDYRIELAPGADGGLSGRCRGRFSGKFAALDIDCAVTGEAQPPAQRPPAGFVAVAPDEHPRLLLRRSELPELRRRAATPRGMALIAQLRAQASPKKEDDDWVLQRALIAAGLLYQLEGDESHARRALTWIATLQRIGYHLGQNQLPEPYAWNARTIAHAYDLFHDAWTPAERQGIADHLAWISDRLLLRPQGIAKKMNWAPGSNYQPGTRGGAAIAALAIWGAKGGEPGAPETPRDAPPELGAPSWTPDAGTPIADLEPGRAPRQWLHAVLAADIPALGADPLSGLGGASAARPTPGLSTTWKGAAIVFSAVDPALCPETGGVDAKTIVGTAKHGMSWWSTALRNDRPRWVQVQVGAMAPRLHLSGRWVGDGQVVFLQPGIHPLLATLRTARPDAVLAPILRELDEAVAKPLAERQAEDARAMWGDWEAEREAWRTNGGLAPHLMRRADLARRHMQRYFQSMMGDGGYQAEGEGYTTWSVPLALEYAHVHATMFGLSPSPRPDVSHFAARYVAQTVFLPKGKTKAQSFGLNPGTIGPDHYSRVWRASAESFRPALHWAWDHFAADGNHADPVFTLLNHPFTPAPASPEGIVPRAWVSKGRGCYIFRNGWTGADDIVAQMYLHARANTGWSYPDGGSLRIRGLGQEWAIEGPNDKDGERFAENVVLMPDDMIAVSTGGRATHWEGRDDGSGSVTADMTPLYRGLAMKKSVAKDKEGKPVEVVTHFAPVSDGRWLTDAFPDIGIRGLRAFAADYSGASGAPALFALVDRIDGGGSKRWVWQVPAAGSKSDPVTIDERGFTVTRGDATLRVTFIAPGDVRLAIKRGSREVREVTEKAVYTGKMKGVQVSAVEVTSADGKGGTFFAVMTLQRGPAPAVTSSGEGVDARAQIGAMQVSFNGKCIVMNKGTTP